MAVRYCKTVFDYSELRERMYIRHVTQKRMASEIGIDPRTIGQWLGKGLPIPAVSISKMTGVLDIPFEQIGYFFFRKSD